MKIKGWINDHYFIEHQWATVGDFALHSWPITLNRDFAWCHHFPSPQHECQMKVLRGMFRLLVLSSKGCESLFWVLIVNGLSAVAQAGAKVTTTYPTDGETSISSCAYLCRPHVHARPASHSAVTQYLGKGYKLKSDSGWWSNYSPSFSAFTDGKPILSLTCLLHLQLKNRKCSAGPIQLIRSREIVWTLSLRNVSSGKPVDTRLAPLILLCTEHLINFCRGAVVSWRIAHETRVGPGKWRGERQKRVVHTLFSIDIDKALCFRKGNFYLHCSYLNWLTS